MDVVKEEEMQNTVMGASEKDKTSSYLVICPSSEIFTFGMSTQERPEQIPNIIAYANTSIKETILNTEFNNQKNIDDSELQKIIDFLKLQQNIHFSDNLCNLSKILINFKSFN